MSDVCHPLPEPQHDPRKAQLHMAMEWFLQTVGGSMERRVVSWDASILQCVLQVQGAGAMAYGRGAYGIIYHLRIACKLFHK